MKKTAILISLILLLNNLLFAQSYKYEFNGIVQHANNPIKNVNIKIYQGENLIVDKNTLLNGYFKFKLKFNTEYFLMVTKDGYKTKNIFISTKIENITSDIKSDFFAININEGSGIEAMLELQLASNGDLITEGEEAQNKIEQANRTARKILNRAYITADSLIKQATSYKDEIYAILEDNKNNTNKNNDIPNANEIDYKEENIVIDKYVNVNPNAKIATIQDTLNIINDLINSDSDKMTLIRLQLQQAINTNDTSQIRLLQEQLVLFDDQIKMLKKLAKMYERQITIQNLELSKNRLLIISISVFLFFILIILFFIAFLYKRKLKSNKKLFELNTNLKKQKDEIHEVNKYIKTSIKYAKEIQEIILPFESEINQHFENFIIFKPKDVVSGDFYWYHEINTGNKYSSLIAVVDCTGHGIPGAFMSILGYNILNHIIIDKKIYEPSIILEELDKEIIKSLKQEQTKNIDGMDIILCKLQKVNEKLNVSFAAAKRTLFLYNSQTQQIEKIKGTRRSIGGQLKVIKVENFETIKVKTNKNDIIYLFSDGYIDQCNIERKRFGTKKLTELLTKNATKPMQEQHKNIEKALNDYQQTTSQRDDITFVGIKI